MMSVLLQIVSALRDGQVHDERVRPGRAGALPRRLLQVLQVRAQWRAGIRLPRRPPLQRGAAVVRLARECRLLRAQHLPRRLRAPRWINPKTSPFSLL
jgi:hypothetical protein